MTTQIKSQRQPRSVRPAVRLEIELPALSDEAAAAVADVLVQLYHRFEATYYPQILNHHADRALTRPSDYRRRNGSEFDAEPF